MKLTPTRLTGAFAIEHEPVTDERGYFVRTFCAASLEKAGLESSFPQHSMSRSHLKGTIRGLHFQREPHGEVKIVRCLAGSIWDVLLDLRPDSPTYRKWQAFELAATGYRQLYVPKGFAHGFQALTDDVSVSYLISTGYAPDFAAGVRFDDPAFGIAWPLPVTMISERDRSWRDFA